ncbi:MAG: hypothetical protein LBC37_08635, partial [Zoogloeaceae bacterium]|nr:hypothetical protein [Zoogloeaceae bacterium]
GRIHEYLVSARLRREERQQERIVIENAEFSGEAFINVAWSDYDFLHCHFPASHHIFLTQLTNCNFIDCEFGPSANNDAMQLGECRDVVFKRCKFNRGSVVFHGKARFESCEFYNKESSPPHARIIVHPYILAGDEVTLVKCRKKGNFTWRGDKRLLLQDCVFGKSGRLGSGKRITGYPREDDIHKEFTDHLPDFSFLDSTFEDAEEVLWGAKLKTLTVRRCVAKEVFRMQGLVVGEATLFEHLREGFFDLAGVSFEGKLSVKNCVFSATGKMMGSPKGATWSFVCAGGVPKEALFERIVCRSDKAANLTAIEDGVVRDLANPDFANEVFIVRDCQIPYLKINWLKTQHLYLENCEIGQLEIRDAQIGKLEIKNTKFERLDLSRTVAAEYAIDASGEITGMRS